MEGKLTFVRHAQSESNKLKLLHGQSGKNVPLSDCGREQAKLAGDWLKKEKFTGAYTSDFTRVMETACGIVSRNESLNKDLSNLIVWTELRERDFGVFEGRTYGEFIEEAKNLGALRYATWRYEPKGSEPMGQLRDRCSQVLKKILNLIQQDWNPNGDIPNYLIATHGGVLHELFLHLVEDHKCTWPAGCSEEDVYWKMSPNSGITQLSVVINDSGPQWKFLRFHSTEHLK